MSSTARKECGPKGKPVPDGPVFHAISDSVANSSHGLNKFGGLAIVDFAAQPLNIDLDKVSSGIELVFPDVLAELGSREYPTGSPHQTFQQRKLPPGQIDATIASVGDSGGDVKSQVLYPVSHKVFACLAPDQRA